MEDSMLAQLRQLSGISEKAIRHSKLGSALALTRREAEIAVAEARERAAAAQVALLAAEANSPEPLTDAQRAYVQAKLEAAQVLKEQYGAEAAALRALLEAEKQIAQLSLELDPTTMAQIVDSLPRPDEEEGLSGF